MLSEDDVRHRLVPLSRMIAYSLKLKISLSPFVSACFIQQRALVLCRDNSQLNS